MPRLLKLVWLTLLLLPPQWSAGAQPATVANETSSGSPHALSIDADPATPRLAGEVIYGRKSGMALTYDIIQPVERSDANNAAVIFVVSGGWNSNWFPPENFRQMGLLRKIHDQGYVLILLRHGSAPRFKVPEAVSDVRLAVRHIRANASQIGFDPQRLGICGASAGGHLSLMMGTTGDDGDPEKEGTVDAAACRVACLVAYYPPTDLRNMVGPSDRFPALDFSPNLAESVSPIAHVTDDDAPVLLVHGTADRLVPLSHSKKLLAEYEKVGLTCELVVLEGAGHGFRGNHAEAAETAVIDWFNRYLLTDD